MHCGDCLIMNELVTPGTDEFLVAAFLSHCLHFLLVTESDLLQFLHQSNVDLPVLSPFHFYILKAFKLLL